jgi:glycosyltransferase involved in cell wall biosynthesis
MKILLLPGSVTGPSSRFRIWQFVVPLKESGHDVVVRVIWPVRYWGKLFRSKIVTKFFGFGVALARLMTAIWITRDIEKFDVVMMNRDLVPEPSVKFLEPWLARRNPNLVFDFDDAIFLGKREPKLRRILPFFRLVLAGNECLAGFARQCNDNVHVWPTVVDTDRFRPAEKREPGPTRIGWSGSKTTREKCLPLLREPLVQLAKKEVFEFVVVADVDPKLEWPGVKVRFIQWTPESEVESLQLMDVGLMPLEDEPFERGKCGFKAISYMAVGIPVLLSPVGVNQEIVRSGIDGYHCSTVDEWVNYLNILINDKSLCKKMGASGRLRAIEKYSINSLIPAMLELMRSLEKSFD